MWANERRSLGLRFALVASVALVAAACSGSSSTILSTVGAPIGNLDGGNAGAHRGAVRGGPGTLAGRRRRREREPEPAVGAARRPQDRLHGLAPAGRRTTSTARSPRAKTAVLATGGYIGASQESNDGDRSVATITYRIPAARWDDAIGSLRGLATKVVAEQTQATEVGGQIVDLEARLRNLRASETSLQAIAQGTGKVSDLLEVEAQLTAVRGPDRAARRPARPARGPGGATARS